MRRPINLLDQNNPHSDGALAYFVAPMVGLSHVALRELAQSYTPDCIPLFKHTEMISTRRLPSERLDGPESLRVAPSEKNLIPQLLGNEESFIKKSIDKLMPLNPVAFDINMGCPVKHTLKHNWGVRLMGDRSYAAQIVDQTVRHSERPVSVKLRVGLKEEEPLQERIDFLRALADAGASWITIHARFASNKHEGTAEWKLVEELRSHLDIPIILNGDIQTPTDISYIKKYLGIDGIMIARAATARPWLLWQHAIEGGSTAIPPIIHHPFRKKHNLEDRPPQNPYEETLEYIAACEVFLDNLCTYFTNETFVIEKFRFFVAMGSKWHRFGHYFWSQCCKAKKIDHLKTLLQSNPLGTEPMLQRVSL